MIFTIPKGKHRARPWRFAIWANKYSLRRLITFNYSAKYDHPGTYDDQDVNKLFGLGYFWNHKKDSVRFGWHFSNETGRVVISSYLYASGQRIFEKLCEVQLGVAYEYQITVHPFGQYSLLVRNPVNGIIIADKNYYFDHNKHWSYMLGIFFGGNLPAPQKITIEMKKI